MKGVNRVTVRGKTYYYDRRTGERLPDDPAQRQARMLEIAKGGRPARPKAAPGTVGDLIAKFRDRKQYRDLADNTKRVYGAMLASLEADYGQHAVSWLDRETIIDIRDDMAETPRAADMMVQVLRRLLKYAVDRPSVYGLTYNHARDVERIAENHPYEAWPDDLVAKFRKEAYPELRLAMEVGLGTGQRLSDCIAMLWSHYDGRRIAVAQKKTGNRLTVPVTAALKAALDAAPKHAMVILTTKTGRPWRHDHLRPEIAREVARLGFPGYSFHGLRKRAGKLLAEAGCTDREIMAVLGHKSQAMVSLYTEAANQERLATAAVVKLEKAGRG